MRYYRIALGATADEIEENARIKLRDYCYDSPVGAINEYMFRKLPNKTTFLIYRVEEDKMYACFSYDERKEALEDAFMRVKNILRDVFEITKIILTPEEITMFDYMEMLNEASRRGIGHNTFRVAQNANLWLNEWNYSDWKNNHYYFQEKLVPEDMVKSYSLYDKMFCEELSNIEEHANMTELKGNMVHYLISARSMEANMDMIETLCISLLKAHRIKSKRIELVFDIGPDFYKYNNHIEDIIENNCGGTIVFDLTERFGYDVTEYLMTCKYIEGLLKKYKNECLFVFTYNMEKPGFSY